MTGRHNKILVPNLHFPISLHIDALQTKSNSLIIFCYTPQSKNCGQRMGDTIFAAQKTTFQTYTYEKTASARYRPKISR